MAKQAIVHLYYSAIEKNKLLMYLTTWMDFKGIMLNEKNLKIWHPKWFHLWHSWSDKIIEIENKLVISRFRKDCEWEEGDCKKEMKSPIIKIVEL